MKSLIKVVLAIVACSLIISMCRFMFSDMKENETYISSTNSKIKIELTKEEVETLDNQGNVLDTNHIAYLHIDDKVYKGDYVLFVSNEFKKELWVNFYDCYEENSETGKISEYFQVKRNKLIVDGDYTYYNVFRENNTFIQKTWWNTWGQKVVIGFIILFVLWLFKDAHKMLKDKEFIDSFRKELKEDFTDEIRQIREDSEDFKRQS